MALSGQTWLAATKKERVACGRKAPGGGGKVGCKGYGESTNSSGSPYLIGCRRKNVGCHEVATV